MRIRDLWPFRRKATTGTLVPARSQGWVGIIQEAMGGQWQRNQIVDNTQTLLAFSAVFACIQLISGDISKLRLKLLRRKAGSDIWNEAESGAFGPVIRKPNGYQTRLQFFMYWLTSKLIWGNVYILKQRDERGVVTELHILDPQRVFPLVSDSGEIYYQVPVDNLAGTGELAELESGRIVIPASEIIHDRAVCLFHPLVGVPPLYACANSGSQGNRIQTNSSKFFQNMSRPSGQLTAPGAINEETATRLKKAFEENFSGDNIGRLLVGGDGLKFEAFTIPAEQAQLIEQLRWTAEDIARAFGVPLYKIGAAAAPNLGNVGALNLEYYQQALQPHIEAIELLLDDGLKLPANLAVEFDLEALLRMDSKGRAETMEIKIRSAVLSPNEARATDNLPPVMGGESPYLQQQNYSLAALAKRDAQEDPFGTAKPPTPAPPEAPPEDNTDNADAQMASFAARIARGLRGSEWRKVA
jgi:HK97 family phage portal protein